MAKSTNGIEEGVLSELGHWSQRISEFQHPVPFHDAISLAFEGVFVGFAAGIFFGLFLATRHCR